MSLIVPLQNFRLVTVPLRILFRVLQWRLVQENRRLLVWQGHLPRRKSVGRREQSGHFEHEIKKGQANPDKLSPLPRLALQKEVPVANSRWRMGTHFLLFMEGLPRTISLPLVRARWPLRPFPPNLEERVRLVQVTSRTLVVENRLGMHSRVVWG